MTHRSRARLTWLLLLAGTTTTACQGSGPPAADEAASEPATEVAVTVAPIVRTTLHAYVTGWGTVAPESATTGRPPAQAAIAAPVSGQVAAIQCTEGQRVEQGTTLFRLDSRVADVAVERARQTVSFAETVVKRQEQLGPGEATSQRAYQDAQQQLAAAQAELRAAEVQREFLDVKAPIDGTVTRIGATLGAAIDPSTTLAEIVDLDRLVANTAIRSVDVVHVARGQRVTLRPGAAPGAAGQVTATGPGIAAVVEYIGAQVDATTDTVLVRARVPTGSGLRPGQFVDVRIQTEERRDQLAVPVESLVQGEHGPEVAIVEGDRAIRVPVTTGVTEGGLIQVEGERVREGVPVVVQGAYGLPAETKIRIIGR